MAMRNYEDWGEYKQRHNTIMLQIGLEITVRPF